MNSPTGAPSRRQPPRFCEWTEGDKKTPFFPPFRLRNKKHRGGNSPLLRRICWVAGAEVLFIGRIKAACVCCELSTLPLMFLPQTGRSPGSTNTDCDHCRSGNLKLFCSQLKFISTLERNTETNMSSLSHTLFRTCFPQFSGSRNKPQQG